MTFEMKQIFACLPRAWSKMPWLVMGPVAPRYLLAPALVFLVLCAFSTSGACQSNEVARITVTVTSVPSQVPGEVTPRAETINGRQLVTLGREHHGQTVAIANGTYMLLRFDATPGAVGFDVSPPGILATPAGILHLPKGGIGVLRAVGPGTATISVKSSRPHASAGAGNPSGTTTPNWSGYVIVGGPFSSVEGTWRVPVVSSDAGPASASWIGLDGFDNGSVLQVGTAQSFDGPFADGPSYSAWYELFPLAPVQIPYKVYATDVMHAKITLSDPATSTWTITLDNTSQGWTFTTQQIYTGPRTSIEWIEEAPVACNDSGCSQLALADYHGTQFETTVDLIASESVNMVQGGVTVSSPSDPGSTSVPGCDRFFLVAFGGVSPAPYDCGIGDGGCATKHCGSGQVCCDCTVVACVTPARCQQMCRQSPPRTTEPGSGKPN